MSALATDVSSPHELMAAIEKDAHSLDAGGRQLAKAIQALAPLAQAYQLAVETEKVRIYHAARESGERAPAEDIRTAMAHAAVDHSVYAAFLTKQAEVDALRAWTRTTADALSARQSLLAAMRAELGAMQ